MFENPRRGRQARNFTTNAPKILVLKSSSEQIFSRKLPLDAPAFSLLSFFRLSSSFPAHSFTHILGNAGMDSLIHQLSKPSHPNVIPKFAIYFLKRDTKHLNHFHMRAPPPPLPAPLVIRCHFFFAPTVQNEILTNKI